MGMRRRYMFLLLKVAVNSKTNTGIVEKSAGTGPKKAKRTKGICTVENQVMMKRAIPTMVAPIRRIIFARLKGIMKPSAMRGILRQYLNGGKPRMRRLNQQP